MTSYNSSFRLSRFIILRKGSRVYDELFHEGINVIRGEHSVGKSMLLDFIYYSLGGELQSDEWKEPADQCSSVISEVYINNKPYCLQRTIDPEKIPPISIYDGLYEKAKEDVEGWLIYGSRRSEKKQSFSEMLFNLFGWGKIKNGDFRNITFDQILRMIYYNQDTDSKKIFKNINFRGDSENTRLAIAEFLLSFNDFELHELRQKLLFAENKRDKINAELNAYKNILGEDFLLTKEVVKHKVDELKNKINILTKEKEKELVNVADNNSHITVDKGFHSKIQNEISNLVKLISEYHEKISKIESELIDCQNFEISLRFRMKSLFESKRTYEILGAVKFEYCPICFTPIHESDNPDECVLCKSHIKNEALSDKYLESINEVEYQLKQNKTVIQNLKKEMNHFLTIKDELEAEQNIKRTHLFQVSKASNKREEIIEEYAAKISSIEIDISNFNNDFSKINIIDQLRDEKDDLVKKIDYYRDRIEILEKDMELRKSNILSDIGSYATQLLENDTGNEEYFKTAKKREVEIDFAKDRWLLDGRVSFSASSNAIKKISLHLAFLKLSINDNSVKYPRFSILDFESEDLNRERSQNMQRKIVDLFKKNKGYQLIITSSKVADELNNDEFGVGRYYAKNDYIIKI